SRRRRDAVRRRGCRRAWAAVYVRDREEGKPECRRTRPRDRLDSRAAWGTIPDEPGCRAPNERRLPEVRVRDRAWNIGLFLLRFTGLYLALGHGHMKIASLMHGEADRFI